MIDFGLPAKTRVGMFMPKEKFYQHLTISPTLKREFIDRIQKITRSHKLSEQTLWIAKTDTIQMIQIFELQLKTKELPKKVIQVIDKAIPYQILYVCRYHEHTAYAITYTADHKKLHYRSERDQEMNFVFDGHSLQTVYQWLIREFLHATHTDERSTDTTHTDTAKSVDFDALIAINEKKKKLTKEIDALRNKITKEKQFNKKVVFNNQLLEKKKELTALGV